jgi:predicted SprT family Zn-dependent metalloprotease
MDLTKAETLAKSLLKKYRLDDWAFKFDTAKRRFGSCDYQHKRITLSKHLTLLNSDEEVKDTLLHEIAHALTPGDNHGEKWQRTCLKLGAAPVRCYTSSKVRQPKPAYLLICDCCGLKLPRYRKSKGTYVCNRCCDNHNDGVPSRRFKLRWHQV